MSYQIVVLLLRPREELNHPRLNAPVTHSPPCRPVPGSSGREREQAQCNSTETLVGTAKACQDVIWAENGRRCRAAAKETEGDRTVALQASSGMLDAEQLHVRARMIKCQ